MSKRASVFIIDDDASVRKGLTRLFRSASYQVQAYASANEFLGCLPDEHPACIILDLKMPKLNGLGLQERLRASNYDLPMIFLTGQGNIPNSVQAIKKGAVDFLEKPVEESILLRVVEKAIAEDEEGQVIRNQIQDIKARLDKLTTREGEVLQYVISGKLNKQAAYDLNISEKTVKVHRSRMMEKMAVQSVADLTRLAAKAGLGPQSI